MVDVSGDGFAQPLFVGRPMSGDRELFDSLVDEMFERNWLSNDGPLVQRLERAIEARLGARHCIAVSNGTVALELLVRALDLSGEVIVPAYTFVATAHALEWLGLTPVFADIDPDTHCISPSSVRERITEKTSAILGVHLWGNIAATEELQSIAEEHSLELLFDAAHAFGVGNSAGMVGSFGRAETFSFHATKFFNTFEGGAIVTADDELARRLRLMRNFGFAGEDSVVERGINGKMTEVCAAMGLTNLASLDDFIAINRRNYDAYVSAFDSVEGASILRHAEDVANNFQYIVLELDDARAPLRDSVVARLKAANVMARKYFWPGVHKMEPYRTRPGAPADVPLTDTVANRVIVLPTGRDVDESAIARIAAIVSAALGENNGG